MTFTTIDWVIITLYLAISIAIGIYYNKFASKGISQYFLGGRNLPWYLAGLSMVATTFAADTPLLVTELVHQSGVSGNWLWWNMAIGGVLSTFFFARLWRRSGILTEVEFIELRYSGKAAKFLRVFKAFYLGVFLNIIIIGWVNVAFISILDVFFDISQGAKTIILIGTMLFAALYSALGGLKGIVLTDAFQFILAMTGSVVLAVVVINSGNIGGMGGLIDQLNAKQGGYMNFFPNIGSVKDAGGMLSIGIVSFLAYIGVQWWSSWYPGAEPGGGGYVAQRMMSTRTEKDSVWATLFFQVAHYAIRPWPWILVGLASVVLYPELSAENARQGYVMAINDFLQPGLKGLMFISLVAAYMSTVSTQLNWGASFVVNDVFKRFLIKDNEKRERKLVLTARLATLALILLSLLPTFMAGTITELWEFLISCGAGLGLVLILRWYWWRVNVWSEISATFAPAILLPISLYVLHFEFPVSLFFIVGTTTIVWLLVTFLTKPEKDTTLVNFYFSVKPYGRWKAGVTVLNDSRLNVWMFVNWISAVGMIYAFLFGMGKMLFQEYSKGLLWLIIAVGSLLVLVISMKKSSNA